MFILHATCHAEKNAWVDAFQAKCTAAKLLDPVYKPTDSGPAGPVRAAVTTYDHPPNDPPPIPGGHPQPEPALEESNWGSQRDTAAEMAATVRMSVVDIEASGDEASPFETYKSS